MVGEFFAGPVVFLPKQIAGTGRVVFFSMAGTEAGSSFFRGRDGPEFFFLLDVCKKGVLVRV